MGRVLYEEWAAGSASSRTRTITRPLFGTGVLYLTYRPAVKKAEGPTE
jgi:hypothetical protein